MPLNRPDFDRISEADLQELQNEQIEEGIFLDYKSELYEPSNDGNKEFLKDATSLANTGGGHIVIGIVEKDGIPTAIDGIDGEPRWAGVATRKPTSRSRGAEDYRDSDPAGAIDERSARARHSIAEKLEYPTRSHTERFATDFRQELGWRTSCKRGGNADDVHRDRGLPGEGAKFSARAS